MKQNNYKNHRLYSEFIALVNDDPNFKFLDNENDFNEWVFMYETDEDWGV